MLVRRPPCSGTCRARRRSRRSRPAGSSLRKSTATRSGHDDLAGPALDPPGDECGCDGHTVPDPRHRQRRRVVRLGDEDARGRGRSSPSPGRRRSSARSPIAPTRGVVVSAYGVRWPAASGLATPPARGLGQVDVLRPADDRAEDGAIGRDALPSLTDGVTCQYSNVRAVGETTRRARGPARRSTTVTSAVATGYTAVPFGAEMSTPSWKLNSPPPWRTPSVVGGSKKTCEDRRRSRGPRGGGRRV